MSILQVKLDLMGLKTHPFGAMSLCELSLRHLFESKNFSVNSIPLVICCPTILNSLWIGKFLAEFKIRYLKMVLGLKTIC